MHIPKLPFLLILASHVAFLLAAPKPIDFVDGVETTDPDTPEGMLINLNAASSYNDESANFVE